MLFSIYFTAEQLVLFSRSIKSLKVWAKASPSSLLMLNLFDKFFVPLSFSLESGAGTISISVSFGLGCLVGLGVGAALAGVGAGLVAGCRCRYNCRKWWNCQLTGDVRYVFHLRWLLYWCSR